MTHTPNADQGGQEEQRLDQKEGATASGPEETGDGADQHTPKGPEVYVVDLHTVQEARFHMPWESTLQQVWDMAYVKLEETRRPTDEFQCKKDGSAMTPYLALTLLELRERHICPDRQFQIHGDSGGACRG